jgi:hypothetical protein
MHKQTSSLSYFDVGGGRIISENGILDRIKKEQKIAD